MKDEWSDVVQSVKAEVRFVSVKCEDKKVGEICSKKKNVREETRTAQQCGAKSKKRTGKKNKKKGKQQEKQKENLAKPKGGKEKKKWSKNLDEIEDRKASDNGMSSNDTLLNSGTSARMKRKHES